mgnify:FL=1
MSDVTQGMSLGLSTLAGGEIEVTAGADAETWAYDTEINATSATLPEIRDSFITWANAGGRAWTGVYTFTGSIVSVASHGPGLGLEVVASASVTLTFNATARAVLNYGGSLVETGATFTSNAAVPGTLYAPLILLRWLALPPGEGTVSGNGSWRNAQPSHSKQIPGISGVINEQELSRLNDIIATAYSPRTAEFYQPAQSAWRKVIVGDLRVTRVNSSFYDLTVEAAAV